MPQATDASQQIEPTARGELLLVVDAGGSKTAAWLVDPAEPESQRVLGRGRASAGNPLSVGFPQAARAVADAAIAARQDAGLPDTRPARAVLSIAGTANDDLRRQLIESLRETRLADELAFVSDVLPILAAGTPDCRGIVLISGTGSVAFARAPDGATRLCGGWGYLLGDEGSGFAIGLAALRFALHDLEAGKEPRPLTAVVLADIGCSSTLEITRAVYSSADPRAMIASVAQVVLAAADKQDTEAQALVDSAAQDLAQLVARAVHSIGTIPAPVPLAVAGSAVVKSQRLSQQLRVELRRLGIAADLVVVEEPLEGCIRLAAAECAALLEWNTL